MKKDVVIIGGGPSGLMAAEIIAKAGCAVTLYERKPSVGRKFLMAGRGGLNITHSEPLEKFVTRYGDRQAALSESVHNFSPNDLRTWCEELGEEIFVGSSGRIFPKSMKASPLLRSWLERLESLGVIIKRKHEWIGWEKETLKFNTDSGKVIHDNPDAVLLALGGASWPSLGSDGTWVEYMGAIPISPFKPANCGFEVTWSPHFRESFSGQPLKAITISHERNSTHGEIMIAQNGIEGGGIYALSSSIRKKIEKEGLTTISVDLRPNISAPQLTEKLKSGRGKQSLSSWLKKTLNLSPLQIALLHEVHPRPSELSPEDLSLLIKSIPLILLKPFSMERAISTAGGLSFDAIDKNFMIKTKPGVFAAGEMLDWEAPTGGYLLQASFATAHTAAHGLLNWLKIPLESPTR